MAEKMSDIDKIIPEAQMEDNNWPVSQQRDIKRGVKKALAEIDRLKADVKLEFEHALRCEARIASLEAENDALNIRMVKAEAEVERNNLAKEIIDEYQRASSKFKPFNSGHEGIAVIREEYLELEYEIFHGTKDKARIEAIQLGAMALRIIRDVLSDQPKPSETGKGDDE